MELFHDGLLLGFVVGNRPVRALGRTSGFRAGFRASGPDFGRILFGKTSKPSKSAGGTILRLPDLIFVFFVVGNRPVRPLGIEPQWTQPDGHDKAHTPGGPAEADHRLWEPPRDSPVPPQGTINRRPTGPCRATLLPSGRASGKGNPA